MNNIYENKTKKYKLKYLKLLKEGGSKFLNSDEEKKEIIRQLKELKEVQKEVQKEAEKIVNTLKEFILYIDTTLSNIHTEILLNKELQNYIEKIYVLQLELNAVGEVEVFNQSTYLMLLEEAEVLTIEIAKAKAKVGLETYEEQLNKQLIDALKQTLYEVNEQMKKKKEEEEKIVLKRSLKKAIEIFKKKKNEQENILKNHKIKLPENIIYLSGNKKIEALGAFYEDMKTMRTIKKNQLAEAERKKQEADNKYKDLETEYNKIIENFEKKTILENIKKFFKL